MAWNDIVLTALYPLQALDILEEMGSWLFFKYSKMPVPDFSENDEEFRERLEFLALAT